MLGMSWIDILWPMMAATSLTLALICVLIWARQHSRREYVAFSIFAACVWVFTCGEWALMRADTPQHYGDVQRWMMLAVPIGLISLAAFMRLYLQAGRAWLFWAFCIIRVAGIPLNFLFGANLVYAEISELRQVQALGGEIIALPVGTPGPFHLVGNVFADALLLLFLLDASLSAWRRGDPVLRRRALVVGGTVSLFFLVAASHAALLHAGLATPPYLVSVSSLGIVAVMSYELGADVLRAAQLTEQLSQSEQRIDLAADAANLGLWTWNVVYDDLWATDRGRRLFGFPADVPLKIADFLQRVHPDERDSVTQAIQVALQGSAHYDREYRIVLPDGQIRWIRAWGQIERDAHGGPRLMRGVVIDLTERKMAEEWADRMEAEALQQRDQLAHLSRVAMLGELSGALAHELNQPLTAILSNAQAAQRFIARGNADLAEISDILADIVEANRRAGDVIRRLRAMLKKDESSREVLDMNELVPDVLRLICSDLLARGMEVTVELAPNLPLVRADRVQLQQVLINLLANACDALGKAAEGSELQVRTAGRDGAVVVSVADRGVGLPPGQEERIFEPFVTSKAHGMGLGLSICRTILQAHEGRLWAENREGGGALFHFLLPALPAGDGANGPAAPDPGRTSAPPA